MKRLIMGLSMIILICSSPVLAGDSGFGMILQTGTMGFGADVVKMIRPDLNIRAGGRFFTIGLDETNHDYDIKYDATLKLQSISLLIDWHGPPAGFFLSGGVFINNNHLEASGISTVNYEYNGRTYTPEEMGDLTVEVDFLPVSPYLGLGWGNAIKINSTVGFVFNLGVLYHGAPDVTLTATEIIEPTAEQEPDIEDDIKGMQVYPVMSLGLSFSF